MNHLKKLLLLTVLLAQSALAAVNVNQADAATIAEELKGVGLSKATAIVAYREKNGPFKTIEQLTEVKGIGLKTVEKNRQEIKLK